MRNPSKPIPRRKLPSLRKHGFSAALIVAILILATVVWMQNVKINTAPLTPTIDVPLGQIPLSEKKAAIEPLPDLLGQENVPLDTNPTENIELLGAPNSPKSITGPRPPSGVNPNTNPTAKTILIDGKPIDNQAMGQALIPAPIQGLSSMTPYGSIPAIDKHGRSALSAYARPFTPSAGKSQLSIVVGGLGVNSNITTRAINELPPEITLAFAANVPSLQTWIDLARVNGHEVLIELSMEGGGLKPGESGAKYSLSTQNTDSENMRNLDFLLSRASGYFSLTNYGGDILVNDSARMMPILKYIKNAGLGFIYDGGSSDTALKSAAQSSAIKLITANGYLDANRNDAASVVRQLNALPTNGHPPVGMGFSYPGTIDGILLWMSQKPSSIELAPVSYALLMP